MGRRRLWQVVANLCRKGAPVLAIPYPRKAILFVLFAIVAVTAIGGAAFAIAQGRWTANVEVRVWEDVNDPERNYISARPEGGSWSTLGTIPLPLTDGVSSSGRFRYGDITLAVPLPDAGDDERCAAAVELAKATPDDVSIVSCISREETDGQGTMDLYGVLSYRGSWYPFVAEIDNRGIQIYWKGVGGLYNSPACQALTSFYDRADNRVNSCTASADLSWGTFEDGEHTHINWRVSGFIDDWNTRFAADYYSLYDISPSIDRVDEFTTTTSTDGFDEVTTITKRISICGGIDTPDC